MFASWDTRESEDVPEGRRSNDHYLRCGVRRLEVGEVGVRVGVGTEQKWGDRIGDGRFTEKDAQSAG